MTYFLFKSTSMVTFIKNFTDLFIATKNTLYFGITAGEVFIGFTVEDDESKIAVGPILGAVCG